MTIVTRTFDKEGNKNQIQKQQRVWMKRLLQKKPQIYCLSITKQKQQ